ncbi:histidine phosphatase family protein [Primorskyibacter aestuariivivens]|uniref:SixA phosphatase family protein n=1 Tax=Primorskyibacter aestuariivivens TaxID=1888912 RepID=UPI002300456F|nr:histidine phosphatase family protein [Primorskyibacter aestuariivivens]MDA7430413.1 histidine phosphatase family protein [Primorskyibacter aestuariivivens]
MTLRLILMRHAKSSWDDPRQADHDRPLNKRGRRSADALGDWLRDKGYLPDLALSSSSLRTQETFERLRLTSPVDYQSSLYHAGPAAMMDALQQAEGQTVLMLGHNPGIAEFSARLVTHDPAHERFYDYPTCATLVAEFPETNWAAIRFGTAAPIDFVIPRELV